MWPNRAGGRTAVSVRDLAVLLVEREQLLDVHVLHAVAIGHHERAVAEVRRERFEPAAGLRVQAGVDQVDGPVAFVAVAVAHHVAAAELDRQVVGELAVFDDVSLDVLRPCSPGDDELVEAVVE